MKQNLTITSMAIDLELLDRITKQAKLLGVSRSQFIREALWAYLKKMKLKV